MNFIKGLLYYELGGSTLVMTIVTQLKDKPKEKGEGCKLKKTRLSIKLFSKFSQDLKLLSMESWAAIGANLVL